MSAITEKGSSSFWTDGYGAFRWDDTLLSRPGTWFLVTKNLAFDFMRVGPYDVNITCVVDDFGDLVRVPA